ncbi:hypothetical protein ES706_05262 [subsurface metagenome]
MPERGFATETWDSDEWFQELSERQRYFFIYLWTNSHCNQAGLYHITLPTISFTTKIPKEELPDLIRSLAPKVKWYPEENLIWVKNFIKRQSKSSKFLAAAAKSLTSIHHNGAIKELLEYNLNRYSISIPYQYYMNRISILTRVTASASDSVSDADKEIGVVKGEGETGESIPPSESEIEESLSEGDREVILVWRSVKGFDLDESAAAELVARLRTEFPDIDILAESKAWAARKLSEPLKPGSRPSAQIWNWMRKAREFAQERRSSEQGKHQRAKVHPREAYRGKW